MPPKLASYKFIEISAQSFLPGRKTRDYVVKNKKTGAQLGTIKWSGQWKQYCLFPVGGTVWSSGCMNDVNHFIRKIKR